MVTSVYVLHLLLLKPYYVQTNDIPQTLISWVPICRVCQQGKDDRIRYTSRCKANAKSAM